MVSWNKIAHYDLARSLGIPVPEGGVFTDIYSAGEYAEELGFPVYATLWKGVGGSTSVIAHTLPELMLRWKTHQQKFLVTKYIPNCRTLAITCLVARNAVWISGYHDKVVDGTRFVKAEYPVPNPNVPIIEEIIKTARSFLSVISGGIRGLCGFNYIYNDEEFWFTNFIHKPQCTVLYTEMALAQAYPNQISMMKAHLMALDESDIPTDLKSLDHNPTQLSWVYRHRDYM